MYVTNKHENRVKRCSSFLNAPALCALLLFLGGECSYKGNVCVCCVFSSRVTSLRFNGNPCGIIPRGLNFQRKDGES